MKINIKNSTEWSTAALRVICRFVMDREGLGAGYSFVFKNAKGIYRYSGNGGRHRQITRINRRFDPRYLLEPRGGKMFPAKIYYGDFKYSQRYEIRSRLELLVSIIAHEAHHATGGHPSKWPGDRRGMEYACMRAADEAVKEFRKQWPKMYKRFRAVMRTERDREQRQRMKIKPQRDPNAKLQRAQENLDRWMRAHKYAANKIKKYTKQVKYYSGRAAAMK
jgi:hypothetical protein